MASPNDNAAHCVTGITAKDETGATAITEIALRPEIEFTGEKRPTESDLATMREQAHHRCFIANSVKTKIRVEAAPAS